jgi:hypothetical protein
MQQRQSRRPQLARQTFQHLASHGESPGVSTRCKPADEELLESLSRAGGSCCEAEDSAFALGIGCPQLGDHQVPDSVAWHLEICVGRVLHWLERKGLQRLTHLSTSQCQQRANNPAAARSDPRQSSGP